MTVKKRNSSIELLKIIALFLCVLCHSLPLYKLEYTQALSGYLNLSAATSDIHQFFLTVFSHLGQVGNAVFLVASAYFLQNSNKVKKEKIILYVLDVFVVSILFLVGFKAIQHRIAFRFIVDSLAPTTFGFYWFITCYILLYAIHPYLNSVIENIGQETLFWVCMVLFFLYCGISFVLGGKFYYTQLAGFIAYYFFVGYWKRYLPNLSSNRSFNAKLLSFGIVGFLGLLLLTNIIGIRISSISGLIDRWESFINPFIVIIAISAFNLCNTCSTYSPIINKISSTSLLVFVISNNELVCAYLKPRLFSFIFETYTYRYIVPICLAIALITFACSVLVSFIYMGTVQKATICFSSIATHIIDKLNKRAFALINKIESEDSITLIPRFSASWISEYRTELMGIASIGVILCHACQHCDLPSPLFKLLSLGNECVDIFLFLGGVGIYFSLEKRSKTGETLLSWYKKRASRVVLPYLVAAIPFYIWFCIYNNYGIARFFYHVSGLSFWGEHEGMWYVDLIVPLYLLSPLIASMLDKTRRRGVVTVGLIAFCFVFSILQFDNIFEGSAFIGILSNIQMVVKRVPSYILGYYFGYHVMKKKQISWLILPTCLLGVVVLGKIPVINQIYRGWLLAIVMMLMFCVLVRMVKSIPWIINAIRWMGSRSLELYLANCILVPLLFTFTWKIGSVDLSYGNYFYYLMVILIGFPLAQSIWVVSNKARRLVKTNKK